MTGLKKVIRHPASCNVLVAGSGKSGFAALKFLHRLGCRVALSDKAQKSQLDGELLQWLADNDIFYETGGHSFELFTGSDLIIVSPGIPLDIPELSGARKAGVEIIGELGLASAFMDIPMIAVTGTNGKTTVTKLIGELLQSGGKKVFVGGNIGTPLADYLLSGQKADVAVVEVSSFQLDTAGDFRPNVALLLNISPDHLDRYASFADYAASKMSIFQNQQMEDAAIINGDDREIMARLSKTSMSAGRFVFGRDMGKSSGAAVAGKSKVNVCVGTDLEEYVLPEPLQESPNRENAMAAIIAARLMDVPRKAIDHGLAAFQRPSHRMEMVGEKNGVIYLDDSKATNIGAVQAALDGMNQPVILIAGGRGKGGDYRLLSPSIRRTVKKMLLIGEAREAMAQALGGDTQIEMAQSLENAVRKAAQWAQSGDAVLLSPACASFDMFQSYAQRGEVFKRAVQRIVGGD